MAVGVAPVSLGRAEARTDCGKPTFADSRIPDLKLKKKTPQFSYKLFQEVPACLLRE